MKKIKKHAKLIAILFVLFLVLFKIGVDKVHDVLVEEKEYTEFLKMVESEEVQKVTIDFKEEKFEFEDKEEVKYETDNPKTEDFKEFLLTNNIEVDTTNSESFQEMLGWGRLLLIIIFFLFIIKKISPDVLQKKDLLVYTKPKVSFQDIAGNDEAKEDMQFMIEFLKNPKSYEALGAKLPKGVVFYGPPGTGKTLTAKALAGEAGVPFFSTSGSDFIEMYAGLGARRVRDLYKSAREHSPCIVFIDEIDSVGTNRGGGNGYNTEKDQTINSLLSELDGFSTSNPVITIVATNRIDDLDKALIRPGRFDKHIAINLPDKNDRLKILKVHSRNKPLNQNVNLKTIANMTIGFSGASLEALMNEAAIIAGNEKSFSISEKHIDDAYYKMIMGGHKKKNKNENLEELTLIAYHEAGHALSSKLLTDNEVPKVTIIPSTTGAGGVTFRIPKENNLMTKKEMLNNIKVLYAGRAAEYILKGNNDEVTNGASQDIKQASNLIKHYFAHYGLSEEFGMLEISDEKVFFKESISLSKRLYNETVELMETHKDKLDKIAQALLKEETINEKRLEELINDNQK